MYIQIAKVHHALVNNVTSMLTKFSLGVCGIVIALARGWLMAVVMIAFLPLMMAAAFVSSHYYKKSERFLSKTKSKSDSEVIEVFENIRTVRVLGGENYESERY
jgi:ABC-type bacteriocin/lantibiotic exporter with double-glycine peptidase domain